MLELKNNNLVFSFPDVHEEAKFSIQFQRTFRIPDDGRDYPLPPGMGPFPMEHVDDHSQRVPESWLKRGGVMLPMYQSEAMWVNFVPHHPGDRASAYPFAVKIAAGKINAASGQDWTDRLEKRDGGGWFGGEGASDYMVVPKQPWLDGYYVDKGAIRQFVAMPLGDGYSAEEQIKGTAEFGGVQIIAYPMKGEVYDRRFPKIARRKEARMRSMTSSAFGEQAPPPSAAPGGAMGLGAGGRMKQEIYDDPFDFDDWAHDTSNRCFVHLTNSLVWRAFTGKEPPHTPPTATEYENAGLPWFDYYDDSSVVSDASKVLRDLKSVAQLGKEKGESPLPENESVNPKNVVDLGRKGDQIRDGDF